MPIKRTRKSSASLYMAGFGKIAPPPPPEAKGIDLPEDGSCLCSAGTQFESCCNPHLQNGGENASPQELILSRYSAYKLHDLDYIIRTTSTQCTDFLYWFEQTTSPEKAIRNWKKNIHATMLDGYNLVKLEIEETVGDEAEGQVDVMWRHLAIGENNVMYPVRERSTLIKENGAWRYFQGEVSRPTAQQSGEMMEFWPKQMGFVQKLKDPKDMTDYEKWKMENP